MTSDTISRLKALQHSLQAARDLPRNPIISRQYVTGINDGLDVALNMIAFEIKLAEADVQAEAHNQ